MIVHPHDTASVLDTPKSRRFRLFANSQVKLRRFHSPGWMASFRLRDKTPRQQPQQPQRRGRLISLLMCLPFGGPIGCHEKEQPDTHESGQAQLGHLHDARESGTVTPSAHSLINTDEGSRSFVDTVENEKTVHDDQLVRDRPRSTTSSCSTVSKRSKRSVDTVEVDDQPPLTDPSMDALHEPTAEEQNTWLLKPIAEEDKGRKCLVLDLDETLVHSSFKSPPKADFVVPVEIDGQVHNVFVLKRPGVDAFMKRMGEMYEIVVFTASLSRYASPVLDIFDRHHVVRHRLFRESCLHYKGAYVKDLSQLGRDLNKVIILDNSPVSYIFHPENAVPVSTWFNDPHDSELIDLIPFLQDLATVDSVRDVLDNVLVSNSSPC